MQREHRCSYCDHAHMISATEIKTAWAFLKCESCGKLSILRGRTPEKISRPKINAAPIIPSRVEAAPRVEIAPPVAASPIIAPKPPSLLVPPPPPANISARATGPTKTASIIKAAVVSPKKTAEPIAAKPAEFIAAKPAAAVTEQEPAAAKPAAKTAKKADNHPFPESLPEVAVADSRPMQVSRFAGLAKVRGLAHVRGLITVRGIANVRGRLNMSKVRERLRTRRGPLSVGVLIIAIGLLMMSAEKLKSQAERLAESSILAAMPRINAPIGSEAMPTVNTPAKEARDAQDEKSSKGAVAEPQGNAQGSTADDAVRTSAAAPAPIAPAADLSLLRVAVEKNAVVLRAGPGTNYRKLGLIGTDATLAVLDWRGDWFRVGLLNSEPGKTTETAWIRNDFVKRITPTN